MSPSKQPTIQDRMDAAGGRPSGFDYLRLFLACSVLFSHSFEVVATHDIDPLALDGFARPLKVLVLPMFFALSGFLVAGSLERSKTLISFLGLRVIRLVPALAVETFLCACVIGTMFTTLPLTQYFADPEFHHYFLNILGDVHFLLPGVFAGNPTPNLVNRQLWTIPWELRCYMAIALLAFCAALKQRLIFLGLIVTFNVVFFLREVLKTQPMHTPVFIGTALILCFLYGITFYLFRSKIIWNRWVFAASLALMFVVLRERFGYWGDYLAPVFLTYITVYLGLLEPRRSKIVASGDYSYGIFLYGYPIQQSVVAFMGSPGYHWFINLAVCLPLTVAVAYCSWHFVEKPALKLRPALYRLEAFFVAHAVRIPAVRFFAILAK